MTDFTEKIKQNALVTISIIVIASVVISLAILFYVGILNKHNLSFLPFVDDSENANEIVTITNVDDEEFIKQITGLNGNASVAASPAIFSKVRIPVLLGDFEKLDVEGKHRGCDTIYFIDRYVAPTTAPLNAAYRELFRFAGETDFYPGNLADEHENLRFDKATIDNGLAQVYISGTEKPATNPCDGNRLRIQLEETALQYNTVNRVEIYLNGELY